MCLHADIFILSNGNWIFSTSLPSRYSYYNNYIGYKVVINEPKRYLKFSTHKVVYAKYKGNNGRQVIIKNSNDPRHYVVKSHPKYKSNGNKKIVSAKNKSTATKSKTPASKGKAGGSGKGKGKN